MQKHCFTVTALVWETGSGSQPVKKNLLQQIPKVWTPRHFNREAVKTKKGISIRMALSRVHTSAKAQQSALITIKQMPGKKHTQCCGV